MNIGIKIKNPKLILIYVNKVLFFLNYHNIIPFTTQNIFV